MNTSCKFGYCRNLFLLVLFLFTSSDTMRYLRFDLRQVNVAFKKKQEELMNKELDEEEAEEELELLKVISVLR